MRSIAGRLKLGGLAVALAVTLVGSAASAPRREARKVYHVLLIMKVLDGKQQLTRRPYPSAAHTATGQTSSRWIARWNLTFVVQNHQLYTKTTNVHELAGFADGQLSGSYPRTNNPPAAYSCAFSQVTPRQIATNDELYAVGTTAGKRPQLHLLWSPGSDPGKGPSATCTGDAVDSLVRTKLDVGVFTGLNQCVRTRAFPSSLLTNKNPSEFTQKFSWGTSYAQTGNSGCNGFGDPILSSASGTYHFRFRVLK